MKHLPAIAVLTESVIDGDTFLMENGERVRLIGVDTPETKLGGSENGWD